ncbi:hypothetical protein HY642_04090 [Candidatus Woesearchaeota archaeon]|nr:hypothetical protein [Candidatus Woesearchaeota archaeon]
MKCDDSLLFDIYATEDPEEAYKTLEVCLRLDKNDLKAGCKQEFMRIWPALQRRFYSNAQNSQSPFYTHGAFLARILITYFSKRYDHPARINEPAGLHRFVAHLDTPIEKLAGLERRIREEDTAKYVIYFRHQFVWDETRLPLHNPENIQAQSARHTAKRAIHFVYHLVQAKCGSPKLERLQREAESELETQAKAEAYADEKCARLLKEGTADDVDRHRHECLLRGTAGWLFRDFGQGPDGQLSMPADCNKWGVNRGKLLHGILCYFRQHLPGRELSGNATKPWVKNIDKNSEAVLDNMSNNELGCIIEDISGIVEKLDKTSRGVTSGSDLTMAFHYLKRFLEQKEQYIFAGGLEGIEHLLTDIDACTFGPAGKCREASMLYAFDRSVHFIPIVATDVRRTSPLVIGGALTVLAGRGSKSYLVVDGVLGSRHLAKLAKDNIDWQSLIYRTMTGVAYRYGAESVIVNTCHGDGEITSLAFVDYCKKQGNKRLRTMHLAKQPLSKEVVEAVRKPGSDWKGEHFLHAWYASCGSPWNFGSGKITGLEVEFTLE